MQVFKSYFKILRTNLPIVLVYVGIFAALTLFMVRQAGGDSVGYERDVCKFDVEDRDESGISRALVDYLAGRNKRVTSVTDGSESIQDAVYYNSVDCVLTIPEGFGEAFAKGQADGLLDIASSAGTQELMLFESDVTGYLNMLAIYLGRGCDVAEADRCAVAALSQSAEVSVTDGGYEEEPLMYVFYNYIGYVLVAMVMLGVTPVLFVYSKKRIHARISVSSYRFANINKELMLGTLITGIAMSSVFAVMSLVIMKGDMMSEKGGLLVLNMLVYTVVSISIAFFLSKVVAGLDALSFIANVVSLGAGFLCGIFVDRQYLGDGVLAAAHLLPTYWYSVAAEGIVYSHGFSEIAADMGAQLLFAAVFVLLGMAADRYRIRGVS